MVLDLIVTITDDGCNAVIPSISGCESWAHEEEDAIKNSIEMLRFYVNLDDDTEIKIDKARKQKNKIIYKVIFDKPLS